MSHDTFVNLINSDPIYIAALERFSLKLNDLGKNNSGSQEEPQLNECQAALLTQ